MITRETLIEIFVAADDRIKTSIFGGLRADRNDLRDREQAERALRWMEDMKIEEAAQVGIFGTKGIKQYQRVRIRKGAPITTTDPRYERNGAGYDKLAGRDYTVEVKMVFGGYIDSHWHRETAKYAARNERVSWAGEGGYWHECDTAFVELVD
jgi:hypothetical protein